MKNSDGLRRFGELWRTAANHGEPNGGVAVRFLGRTELWGLRTVRFVSEPHCVVCGSNRGQHYPHLPEKSNFNNSSEVSTISVATSCISLHCRPHSQNSQVHSHGNGVTCKIMHLIKLRTRRHATNIYRSHLLTMISFRIQTYCTTSI